MPDIPPPPPLEHAHHAPPPHIRAFHKAIQKGLPTAYPILDFANCDNTDPLASLPEWHCVRLTQCGTINASFARDAFREFGNNREEFQANRNEEEEEEEEEYRGKVEGDWFAEVMDVPVYAHSAVPGLRLIPNLLPTSIQLRLLSTLLHRDLSATTTHATNLHLHYHLPPPPFYFFSTPPTHTLTPRDPTVHSPLPLSRAITKKLRWLTLGGQYDWTAKRYPTSPPPPFPPDVAGLIGGLFGGVRAEAAILNIYAPGDMLAPHRDVAEECARPLVSVSVGCAGVFVIGLDSGEEGKVLAVRLRSGDAVMMAGESRWAWHSVPRIEKGTCPSEIEAWPVDAGGEGGVEQWKNWMKGRRINLNVRQMRD